jgi:hypothetical protein
MNPKPSADHQKSNRRGYGERKDHPVTANPYRRGNFQRSRLVPQRAEQLFQLLDLSVRFTRSIPKIIVVHSFLTLPARHPDVSGF